MQFTGLFDVIQPDVIMLYLIGWETWFFSTISISWDFLFSDGVFVVRNEKKRGGVNAFESGVLNFFCSSSRELKNIEKF